MTREDIIRMAREAGADTLMYWDIEKLKRFESLVRADERDAIIDLVAMYGGPVDLEAAIRARGQA
jgi:hypothetical protein